MLIEGAALYGGAPGKAVADRLTRAWVESNMAGWRASGHMHEKYNVQSCSGGQGGGGEYQPQVGFGWSNGVLLDLLDKFYTL